MQELYKQYPVAKLRDKAALAQHNLPGNVDASQHEAAPLSRPATNAQALAGQQRIQIRQKVFGFSGTRRMGGTASTHY
jgi:hypothetical protein